MAITEMIFGVKQKVRVGSEPPLLTGIIQFDCSLSETHTDEAEVVEHPVEDGSNIADHIRKLPVTLELNGLVTDTPLVYLASFRAVSPVQGSLRPAASRVDEAYAMLQEFMDNGDVVFISTSLRDYRNMAIASLAVTRDAESGQALNCSISFREVLKAKSFAISLPIPKEVQNKEASDQGNKPKQDSTPKQTSQADQSSVGYGLIF